MAKLGMETWLLFLMVVMLTVVRKLPPLRSLLVPLAVLSLLLPTPHRPLHCHLLQSLLAHPLLTLLLQLLQRRSIQQRKLLQQ